MAKFKYEFRTPSGDTRTGSIDAPDQANARQRLREQKINPTNLTEAGGFNLKMPDIAFFKPKVITKDLVIFTRQFATMIDSGLPLVQCLDILSKQTENPTLRGQLVTVKEKVESGSTFGDSLKGFPDSFDDLYVNLVSAGEVGGMLDTIMNRLAAYLERTKS